MKMKTKTRHHIVWRNVFIMGLLHVLAIVSLTQLHRAKFRTLIWEFLYFNLAGLGVTAGAHRLWSHRSYKAKLPLRILLGIMNSCAFQNSILEWSRDHRVHHKHSETDADPHNAKRGFFFAHVGWLMMRKHPDVKSKGKNVDLSDLYNDPVVMFQARYYVPVAVLMSIFIPTVVPVIFWEESIWISYLLCLLRLCIVYNATWMVNSVAHIWGNRPYDISINPAENLLVSLMAVGEGFHNYHHTFPHDYSTSEFGFRFNLTTAFIDVMAFLGLAYDCRKVEPKTVLARRRRTGDLAEQSETAK